MIETVDIFLALIKPDMFVVSHHKMLSVLYKKDQNVFCIVNCKEDYDHLNLACKPIFQKINTLCKKASIEVEGKHFDLDILMGGDMKILQLVLG
jgi:hypothetical protein